MTLKGHVLLTGSHMEPGKKETISQSCIRTDYRDYKFFAGTLVNDPQRPERDPDTEIHLEMKIYISQ